MSPLAEQMWAEKNSIDEWIDDWFQAEARNSVERARALSYRMSGDRPFNREQFVASLKPITAVEAETIADAKQLYVRYKRQSEGEELAQIREEWAKGRFLREFERLPNQVQEILVEKFLRGRLLAS